MGLVRPPTLSRQPQWVQQASAALGVPLHIHAQNEAAGPCPKCGKGTDRFVVFLLGNAWCRRCGHKTWWIADPDEHRAAIAAELEAAEARRVAAQTAIANCHDWTTYADAVRTDRDLLELWLARGISEETIARFGLGYCPACPLHQASPSLTIPVWHEGRLLDIRHRLLTADPGSKYRSHMVGLPTMPFNLDSLGAAQRVLLVEGEIKTIVLSQFLPDSAIIGLPGAANQETTVTALQRFLDVSQSVSVGLDPDAADRAANLARTLNAAHIAADLVDFPLKPDDFALRYGADAVRAVLEQSRPA